MNEKGTYVLVVTLDKSARFSAGRLPETEFRPGTYLYIGRARKGLRGRLNRHITKNKKVYWHIDHLLQRAQIEQIWIKNNFFEECRTAEKINAFLDRDSTRINRFGSSDCRCSGHLFFSSKKTEDLEPLRTALDFEKVNIQGDHV